MPSKSCLIIVPKLGLTCVKNFTLSTNRLFFLLSYVDFNNCLTQFVSRLFASRKVILRGVVLDFIHKIHSPYNNYNLFYLIIYYCFKRKRGYVL